jgi:RNA polymerase sigma-70 factor, ECF subfamily
MASGQVTQLLVAWAAGNEAALDPLMTLVYDELHGIARRHLARERPGILQPTALVHEAYLRLIEQGTEWQNRAHFFAIAARIMRRILVDHARARQSARRGGDAWPLSLGHADVALERAGEVVALDDALGELAAVDPRKARVVELRFFGGLSVEETAEVLGVSAVKALEIDRTFARAGFNLAEAYRQQGLFEEALTVVEDLRAGADEYPGRIVTARFRQLAGRPVDTQALVDEVLSRREYVPAFFVAQLYAMHGDNDRAFQYLEKARAEGGPIARLYVDPYWETYSLFSDPRFAALLRSVGLPPRF